MSIRNAEEGRAKQQRQRAAKRDKEAEARPDTLHRAVIFLLRAAKENNPDLTEEATHHIDSLDAELAIPDKLVEIEKPSGKATAADEDDTETDEPKKDTAKAIRQSRRFQRS